MALQGKDKNQQIREQRHRVHLRRHLELYLEPNLDLPKRERGGCHRIRQVHARLRYRIGNQFVNTLSPDRQTEMELLPQQDFRHRRGDAVEFLCKSDVYIQIRNQLSAEQTSRTLKPNLSRPSGQLG